MRKPLLIAGTALLLLNAIVLRAQTTASWANSFSPSWAPTNNSGSAPDINGSGVSGSVKIDLPNGFFTYVNGILSSMSPTVSGSVLTVAGSNSNVQIAVDFPANTDACTITYLFTSPVTNVTFRIADIDKLSSASSDHIDNVTITGENTERGGTTYSPVITKYDPVTDPDFLVINGNTVSANPASGNGGDALSDAVDQRGTATIDFGSSIINSITIVYGNHSSAQTDPGVQSIAIGDIFFEPFVVLPVSLTSFSGQRQSQNVVLDWKTQQEVNIHSYNVERNNGSAWETIGTVNAVTNNGSGSSYTYTDINPQGAILLYRLKQIDLDNHYKYSGIVRITGKDSKITLVNYPNPFTEQVTVNISSPVKQQVTAIIYDAAGKTIRSESKSLYTGTNSFIITGLDRLTRGNYYIEIKDTEGGLLGRSSLLKN